MYTPGELQLLLGQTAKLRRDPSEAKAEVDAIENEEWIEKNLDSTFSFTGEDGLEVNFNVGDFM